MLPLSYFLPSFWVSVHPFASSSPSSFSTSSSSPPPPFLTLCALWGRSSLCVISSNALVSSWSFLSNLHSHTVNNEEKARKDATSELHCALWIWKSAWDARRRRKYQWRQRKSNTRCDSRVTALTRQNVARHHKERLLLLVLSSCYQITQLKIYLQP